MADFDEYEYLEKTVEAPSAEMNKDMEHRSSRHDNRDGDSGDQDRGKERSSRSDRRDKDREHRSSGSRETDHKDRDREKERERDKEKDRDRDRERRSSSRSRRHDRDEDRERDMERRSSSHSRRHERDEDRERDRERSSSRSRRHERDEDRERDRERRSSSHSRRHDREAEKEMERSRSRDRALRERELERELRERESRRFKDKREAVEPEADPERDQRTVFAYQMPLKATERDVYEFFSQVGKVRDVRLIMDRNSRRSKGVGYVEFYDVMSVPNAIALSGHLLLGQPVMVKPSEAEKNLVQSTTAGVAGAAGTAALRKLYVGNLHFSITEDQLRQIFEPFGPVELVQLPLDLETGHCRGYGFVQFAQLEHAKAAQSLNGKLDIAGRIIKVSAVSDHVPIQDSGATAGDLDDEDGTLAIDAQSRAILMQKLDRSGTALSVAGSLAVPAFSGTLTNQLGLGLPVNVQAAIPTAIPTVIPTAFPSTLTSMVSEPVGKPSEYVLLRNMFDPKTETEPDFDLDIKEDVQEECSKFGHLRHIYVDKNSNGCVYLCFETVAAATSCQQAMHGRWFAGRSISTTFMSREEYESKFQGMI